MSATSTNVRLYPWFKFCQNLLFWQSVWFLYFQNEFSAAQAILLYAIYDIATTALEVPSGYMSDRFGRRITLLASSAAGILAVTCFAVGGTFAIFVVGNVFLGASIAFVSGTDTSFLYESLVAEGRKDEVEEQELIAWRFTFAGLAISAFTGGVVALYSMPLTFVLCGFGFAGAFIITWISVEPPHVGNKTGYGSEALRLQNLRSAFADPVLIWLFVLSVLMYGFSHLPFIFGPPYILDTLGKIGLEREAPWVSGAVSTCIMLVSVATSLVALRLRKRLGLPLILLLAFFLQVLVISVLALTSTLVAIAVLLLRSVPNSLSQPFIAARIQPHLTDDSRATYLSIRGLVGRLLFAGSLWLASVNVTDAGLLDHSEIRLILGCYAGVGLAFLIGLGIAALRLPIEDSLRKSDSGSRA